MSVIAVLCGDIVWGHEMWRVLQVLQYSTLYYFKQEQWDPRTWDYIRQVTLTALQALRVWREPAKSLIDN